MHLREARGRALLLSGVPLLHQLRGGGPIQQHATEQPRQLPHMLHGCTMPSLHQRHMQNLRPCSNMHVHPIPRKCGYLTSEDRECAQEDLFDLELGVYLLCAGR